MAEEDQISALRDEYVQKRLFWPVTKGMWTVLGLLIGGFMTFFIYNLQSSNELRERVNAAMAETKGKISVLDIRISDLKALEDSKISALELRVVTIKELEDAIRKIEQWQANNDRIIEGRDAIQCNDIRHLQVTVNAMYALINTLLKRIDGDQGGRHFSMLPVADCAPGAGTR